MKNTSINKAKRIVARIEALENAAALIAGHMESGMDPIEGIEIEYPRECKKLANQLNRKANALRKKYNDSPNSFKY